MSDKDFSRERDDAEWVTSTEQGRRFMWRLLSHCGIYRDFEGTGDELLKQVGRRQVGLYLLSIISDASEDRIFEMMREAKNRSIEERVKNERANTGNGTSTNDINAVDDFFGDSDLPSYDSGGDSIF